MNSWLPLVAIIISVSGLLLQYFSMLAKVKDEIAGLEARVNERLARLETKTDLFWSCVQNQVLTMLKTFPSNISKDILLDKMLHNELTLEEAAELRTVLKGEVAGKSEMAEVLVYTLALGRLEQIIFDLKPRR